MTTPLLLLPPPPLMHPPKTIPLSQISPATYTSTNISSHPSPSLSLKPPNRRSCLLPPLPPPPKCRSQSITKIANHSNVSNPSSSPKPVTQNRKHDSKLPHPFPTPPHSASSSQPIPPLHCDNEDNSRHGALECSGIQTVHLPDAVEDYIMEGSKAELIEHVAWLRELLSDSGTKQNRLQFTVCKLNAQIEAMNSGKFVKDQASLISNLQKALNKSNAELDVAKAKLCSCSCSRKIEPLIHHVSLSGKISEDQQPPTPSYSNLNSNSNFGTVGSDGPIRATALVSFSPRFLHSSPITHLRPIPSPNANYHKLTSSSNQFLSEIQTAPASPPTAVTHPILSPPTHAIPPPPVPTKPTTIASDSPLPSPSSPPSLPTMHASWADTVRKKPSKMNFTYFKPPSNDIMPSLEPPNDIFEDGEHHLKGFLMGFFHSKRLPFPLVQTTAIKAWSRFGLLEVLGDDKGLFYFKFTSEVESQKFLSNGPWSIAGRPIFLSQWNADLDFSRNQSSFYPVWVKFFNVPIQFWTARGLSFIASSVGKPLHADESTENRSKIRFARLLIEVDLKNKPIESIKIKVGNNRFETIRVEYQRLPSFCNDCSSIGHNISTCRASQIKSTHPSHPSIAPSSSPQWTVVTKCKSRKMTPSSSSKVPSPLHSISTPSLSQSLDHHIRDIPPPPLISTKPFPYSQKVSHPSPEFGNMSSPSSPLSTSPIRTFTSLENMKLLVDLTQFHPSCSGQSQSPVPTTNFSTKQVTLHPNSTTPTSSPIPAMKNMFNAIQNEVIQADDSPNPVNICNKIVGVVDNSDSTSLTSSSLNSTINSKIAKSSSTRKRALSVVKQKKKEIAIMKASSFKGMKLIRGISKPHKTPLS